MVSVPYFQRYGPQAEIQLLQCADVATANPGALNDSALRHDPQSHDVGQYCILTHYQAATVYGLPAGLAIVPQPRVGYTGFPDSVYLVLSLLLTLARKLPDWHLVLVGSGDEDFWGSPLHAPPNVHFPGNKMPDQPPAYVQYFDVCINPQAGSGLNINHT